MKLHTLVKNIANRLSYFVKKALVLGVMGVICGGLWGGNYRWKNSVTVGDWSNKDNWEYSDSGIGWGNASQAPGTDDTIYIPNGNGDNIVINLTGDVTGITRLLINSDDKGGSVTINTNEHKISTKDLYLGQKPILGSGSANNPVNLIISGEGTLEATEINTPGNLNGKSFDINVESGSTLQTEGKNGKINYTGDVRVQNSTTGVYSVSNNADLAPDSTITVTVINDTVTFDKLIFDITITNSTTTKNYTVYGTDYSSTTSNVEINFATSELTQTFNISLPATMDPGETVSIKIKDKNGSVLKNLSYSYIISTSTYETGDWDITPGTYTENIIIKDNFTVPNATFFTELTKLTSVKIQDDKTLDVSAITNYEIIDNKLTADSTGTLSSTGTISLTSSNFVANNLSITANEIKATSKHLTCKSVSTSTTTLSGNSAVNTTDSSSFGVVNSSGSSTTNINCSSPYTVSGIKIKMSGANLIFWGGDGNAGTVTITGDIKKNGGTNNNILFHNPVIFDNGTSSQIQGTSSVTFEQSCTVNNSFTFDNAGTVSFKDFTMNGVVGTLTVGSDITVNASLTLKGQDASNTLNIEGAGKIILSSDQDSGQYLTVDATNTPEISGAYFHAADSTSTDIPAVMLKGWIIGNADDSYWMGTTDTDWENQNNWLPKAVPDSSKNVIIKATSNARYPETTATASIKSLVMEASTSLTATSKLTITDAVDFNKAVTLSGLITDDAGITLSGTVNASGTFTSSTGITTSGTITISDNTTFSGAVTNSGTLSIDSGKTLSIFSGLADTGTVSGAISFTGTGTFTPNTSTTYSSIEVNASGKTVTVADTLKTASLTITAGTIKLDNQTTVTETLSNSETIDSNAEIIVQGNFNDSGTFTEGTNSKITLSGSTAQTFAAGTSTYKNITVNKTGGKTSFTTNTLNADTVELTASAGVDFEKSVSLSSLANTGDCGDITFSEGGTIATDTNLQTTGNVTIAEDKTLTIEDSSSTKHNFTHNTGTTTLEGNITASNINLGNVSIKHSVTITGNVTLTGGADAANKKTLDDTSTHTLTIKGSLTINGEYEIGTTKNQTIKLDPSSGTITNNGTLTVPHSSSFTGSFSNSGTLNVNGTTVSINGNLTNTGAITVKSKKTLSISSDFDDSGSSSDTSGAISFTGTGTFTPKTSTTYSSVEVNASGATVTVAAELEATNLTITASTLSSSNNITAQKYSGSGTIKSSGGIIKATGTSVADCGTLAKLVLSTGTTSIQGNLTISEVAVETPGTTEANLTIENITGKTNTPVITNLNLNKLKGTVTFNNTVTVTTLTLIGQSTTDRLSVAGSGSIILSTNQDSASNLSVGTGVSIISASGQAAGSGTYKDKNSPTTSVPSAGTTDADYAALIRNGWLLKDQKLFTYTWKTDTSDSDWGTATNWDIGLVPVTDAKIIIPAVTGSYKSPVISSSAVGGNITINLDASLTFSDAADITLSGKSGDNDAATTLSNSGTIIYQNSGRIKNSSGNVINDVTAGTVEYSTASGTISEIGTTDYNNLKISSGTWSCPDTVTASKVEISGGSVSGTFTSTNSISVTGTVTISDDTTFSGTVTNTGAITVSNDKILSISSDFNDSGSTSATTGAISFTGTGTFTPNTSTTYSSIEVNASGATVTVAATLKTASLTITTGTIKLDNQTTVTGALSNSDTIDSNAKIIVQGNFTDSGTFTENTNSEILLSGTADQTFVPVATTTYKKITVNKYTAGANPGDPDIPTGTITFETNDLKATALTLTSCNGATFEKTVTLNSVTDTATAGDITFKGDTTISNDVTFLTTGTVQLGSVATNVTTLGLPAPYNKFTHTAGPTKLFGKLIAAEATFATVDCGSDITLDIAQVNLNGNVTSSASYIKLNGNLTTANTITVAPKLMLNGSFDGDGNATFNSDLYIFSPIATPAPVRIDTVTIIGNLIINSPCTITTSGNIKAGNIVLYRGDIISAADSTLEATNDIVLLGANYNISNSDSGNTQEFLYQQTRLSAANYSRANFDSTNTDADKMPDGTALSTVTSGFSGTYTAGPGATLKAGKNFYANGTTFNANANWFISLPDITNASNGFAETVYTSTVFSTIRCNADSSTDGSKARMPAYFYTDNGNNVNWIFDDFEITEVHTVRDDTLKITFNRPVRNVNSELIDSVARFVNSTDTYSDFYTDADCQNPLTAVNIASASIYLKSNNSWNTDATGTSSGHENATDRSGIHKTVTPYLEVRALVANSKIHISDIWGKRIRNYDGDNRFIAVTDKTGPVLYSVRTGQELHTEYDPAIGPDSQPSYDAHNFIEFRYSEPVNFGDPALATPDPVYDNTNLSQNIWLPASASTVTNGVPDINNVRVRDSFGALLTDVTQTGNISLAGLGTITGGQIYTASNGSPNKYVNSLYRPDEYSIRLSIAGYTEGTVTDRDGNVYKKWPGYIESAVIPSDKVSMVDAINPFVTDCALESDGTTSRYNKQEEYISNKVEPTVNSTSSNVYGPWDLSAPVFAPLRLKADEEWSKSAPEEAEYYEAVGNTTGSGSTLQKIEFHFFDNTPDYTKQSYDDPAWLTEKGWVHANKENSKDLFIDDSYCADNFGGSRPYEAPSTRTTGGLRFSTIANASKAFKYIPSQVPGAVPNTPFSDAPDAIYPGAKAPLFTGSSATRRPADDPDGLYFGIQLSDTSMPLDQSFTISYTESDEVITDLAGNRLRSAKIKTIDRTPPSYDFILSPISQNEIYMVFVKELAITSDDLNYKNSDGVKMPINETFESLIPKCFEIFKMSDDGKKIDSDLQIDTSVPAKVETIESEANHQIFTTIRLRLNRNITLKDIEDTYLRVKIPAGDYGPSQDPVTGLNESKVTFIQDHIGNYMQEYSAHSLSDFAISSINPLYAYDQDMEYNGVSIMNGLYEEGSWAVHDWNADQQNYGTLPANHPYGLVADIETGTDKLDCKTTGARLFLSANPDAESISNQINSDLNLNLRIWLPEIENSLLQFMALKNTTEENYSFVDSSLLDASSSQKRLNFDIPRDITELWGSDKQISFLFGLTDSENEIIRIYNTPYYDVGNNSYNLRLSSKSPLYALRLTNPEDITSIDLWSFKTKSIIEQRGGVTILNNVINATNGEKVALKVNMPSEGKLNVTVMTLDGNIITYLNHGNTSAGEHYYSWNGRNKAGNLVARGMYFIRVVGNGIDETRKVMVVK